MCETLVDVTKQIVKDATEQIAESEDAYQVRLEAHEIFARSMYSRQRSLLSVKATPHTRVSPSFHHSIIPMHCRCPSENGRNTESVQN
jgi:hypothetical protein